MITETMWSTRIMLYGELGIMEVIISTISHITEGIPLHLLAVYMVITTSLM